MPSVLSAPGFGEERIPYTQKNQLKVRQNFTKKFPTPSFRPALQCPVATTDIYFDFEFIDDGKEIVPISLGMCAQVDDVPREFYTEYMFDPDRANDWVRENVFPHLTNTDFRGAGGRVGKVGMTRATAAPEIVEWVKGVCGDTNPRFWGYYPSYDWVLLCQHFGTMMELPKGWPKRPECLKQLAGLSDIRGVALPTQPRDTYNALADAKRNRELHEYLKGPVHEGLKAKVRRLVHQQHDHLNQILELKSGQATYEELRASRERCMEVEARCEGQKESILKLTEARSMLPMQPDMTAKELIMFFRMMAGSRATGLTNGAAEFLLDQYLTRTSEQEILEMFEKARAA